MTYKIAGYAYEDSRLLVIKQSDWSIESTVSGISGSFKHTGLSSENKLVIARSNTGAISGYSYVAPLEELGDIEIVAYNLDNSVVNPEYSFDEESWVSMGEISQSGYTSKTILSNKVGDYTIYFRWYDPDTSESYFSTPQTKNVVDEETVTFTFYVTENQLGSIRLTMQNNDNSTLTPMYSFDNSNWNTTTSIPSGESRNFDIEDLSVGEYTIYFRWYDPDTGQLHYSNSQTKNVVGGQMTVFNFSTVLHIGDRGVFGGGHTDLVNANAIDYITIMNTSNASTFGDLTVSRYGLAACANSTRGVFGGGWYHNIIEYVTINSLVNAQDFGDLMVYRGHLAACANSTRGVFGSGTNGVDYYRSIEYITISTTGNASYFGEFFAYRHTYPVSACASSTRGVFGGGSQHRKLDYITISTTGDSIEFGEFVTALVNSSSCSNSTRGLFGGSSYSSGTNVIEYITISTTGNAKDFGDLSTPRSRLAACSNSTRGVFGGGYYSVSRNIIEYITISTKGNATNFGQLTVARGSLAACSNSHGGLS